MLSEADQASVAVAFWGEGAERLFAGWRGGPLRIICNLSQGGTNPTAITALQSLPGAQVRQLSDLHAKLVLTDHQLVVGSANVSTNGLGLERNEVAGWRETGILSEDPLHLRSAADWFNIQWQAAQPVTPQELSRAAAAWKPRRGQRPLPAAASSFLTLTADDLRDRPVYMAVYRNFASQRAKEALEDVKEKAASEPMHQDLAPGLEVFEDWTAGEMPDDPNAVVIQVYWGRRGRIAIYDVLRPVPELKRAYVDEEDGEPVRLDFLVKRKRSDFWYLSKSDRDRLMIEIRPWVEQLTLPEEEGRCIPAFEWRQWQADQADRQAEG